MASRVTVRLTANFQRNLDAIQAYLVEHDAPSNFEALLEEIFDVAIPNLTAFPEIGIDFLNRVPSSHQGKLKLVSLRRRIGEGATVRQLILGDYLILYAVREQFVYLLAIKHHLQLSFDFQAHWLP
jgi:plasmid stabilization system protein ParE